MMEAINYKSMSGLQLLQGFVSMLQRLISGSKFFLKVLPLHVASVPTLVPLDVCPSETREHTNSGVCLTQQ